MPQGAKRSWGGWISGRMSPYFRKSVLRRQPVFERQAGYAGELLDVVRHQDQVQCQRLGRDQEIVGPDRPATAFESQANFRILAIRRLVQRQDLEALQQ